MKLQFDKREKTIRDGRKGYVAVLSPHIIVPAKVRRSKRICKRVSDRPGEMGIESYGRELAERYNRRFGNAKETNIEVRIG